MGKERHTDLVHNHVHFEFHDSANVFSTLRMCKDKNVRNQLRYGPETFS